MAHEPCPGCGSSDALARYSDGHAYCFSCGHREPKNNHDNSRQLEKEPPITTKDISQITPIPDDYSDLKDRGILASVAKAYGVSWVSNERDPRHHIYPYHGEGGHHIANKMRLRMGKKFPWEGDNKHVGLFGHQLFPPNPKLSIMLTEGECDAMAAYQMNGQRWPVVSLINGADAATRDVANNFEYLNGFKEIVLCFDKDEGRIHPRTGNLHYPGQDAAERVARMFKPGKVRVMTLLEHKDANEYLVAGDGPKFQREYFNAPVYTPTGLKLTKDMWEDISNPPEYETTPYPWESLNHKTYGMRLSELTILTADTGVGKTSILKEVEHHILGAREDSKIGLMHFEEPNRDTALGLMSITLNKPLHLPDVRDTVTTEELRGSFDTILDNDRVIIWDHFGSNQIEEVLSKVRHMHNMGAKYIFLDHLSIVVSDQNGDERKQLDEITTKLKTLCMELNIFVLAVIHINREGKIRGTAAVEQLANIVIRLERDKKETDPWRRNVTRLSVEKNRFCGRTGPATYLFYREETGRLEELTAEEIHCFENGDTKGEEFDESWS